MNLVKRVLAAGTLVVAGALMYGCSSKPAQPKTEPTQVVKQEPTEFLKRMRRLGRFPECYESPDMVKECEKDRKYHEEERKKIKEEYFAQVKNGVPDLESYHLFPSFEGDVTIGKVCFPSSNKLVRKSFDGYLLESQRDLDYLNVRAASMAIGRFTRKFEGLNGVKPRYRLPKETRVQYESETHICLTIEAQVP